MKYFIIHSGSDHHRVKPIVSDLKKSFPLSVFIMLETANDAWKTHAKQNIEDADKIIFFTNSNMEQKNNIEYELQQAVTAEKDIYIYKLDKKSKISQNMANVLHCDSALKNRINVFSEIAGIKSKLKEDSIARTLHNSSFKTAPTEYMDQYHIMVQTSEDLVKRKQTTNNIYVTLNLAILSILIAIAGINSTSGGAINGVFITLFGIPLTMKVCAWIVVGVFGTLLCISWLMVLKNYANLNSAKMTLIIQLEQKLPLNLFDTEWKYVSLKNKNGKYIPFSRSEKLRAVLFLLFYILVVFGGIVLVCRGI